MTYDWNKQVEITVPTGTNGWIYSGEVTINGVKVRFPVGVPTTVPEPAAALLNKMIELEREDENNTAKPDNHYVGNVTIPEGKTLTLAKGAKVVDEDGVLGGSSTPAPVVILPETELIPTENDGEYIGEAQALPEDGKTYAVTYNGTAHDCTCVAAELDPGAFVYLLGNIAAINPGLGTGNTEAPFMVNITEIDGGIACYCVPMDGATSVTISIVEAAKTESAGGGGRFTFNGTIASEPKGQNGSTMTFDITFDKEYSEVEKAWNDGQSVFCVIDMGLMFDGEEREGYFAYLPVITYNINTNEIVCALNFNGSNLAAWIYSDTAQNQFQMTLPSA